MTSNNKKLLIKYENITQINKQCTDQRICCDDRIAFKIYLKTNLKNEEFLYVEFDNFSPNCSDYLLCSKKNICRKLQNVRIESNNNSLNEQFKNVTNLHLLKSKYNYTPDSMQSSNEGTYGRFQLVIDDQILFAYNDWNGDGDIGLGNNNSGCKDWTFSNNGKSYSKKKMEVFIVRLAEKPLICVS